MSQNQERDDAAALEASTDTTEQPADHSEKGESKGRIRASALRKAARLFRAKHGADVEDAEPGFRAPREAPIQEAPQSPDPETRALLKALRRQQSLHLKAEMAEAEELARRAQEITKNVKAQQRLRQEISKHYEYVQSIVEQLGFDPNRPVTRVSEETEPGMSLVETITIQPGFAYVRILHNEKRSRHEYEVIEPQLSKTEEEVLRFVRDTLVRTMDARTGTDRDTWEAQLLAAVERIILDHSILVDDIARQKIQYYILRDFLGYGPIDVIMRDPMVEDISCDGPGIPVFLYHRQYESIRTNVVFDDELALDGFVIRLGQRSGKHISIADPLLDATLPDKSRLQATLAREVTTHGSSFTIRRFRGDPLTPPDLVRLKTWSPAMAAYFWFAMQEGNSILYAGGTASGKTTALNAMGIFIPPEKKIVSIEDTREINLPHENWIAGVTRSGFGTENMAGKRSGEVDMFKLLEAALRQRPEYLIVGEVRGPEAQTLFQAMATGHATYSTVHADSAASAVYRLENEPISVPRMMLQTADIIAVQIQSRVGGHMVRRLKEVVEIVGMDPETGDLLTNKVFEWDPASDEYFYFGNSHVLDLIRQKRALRSNQVEDEWSRRTRVVRWMVETGIRNISDVSNVVSTYYSQPDLLMSKVAAWEAEQPGGQGRHPTEMGISEAAAARPAFSYDATAPVGPQILSEERAAAQSAGLRAQGHPNDAEGSTERVAPAPAEIGAAADAHRAEPRLQRRPEREAPGAAETQLEIDLDDGADA